MLDPESHPAVTICVLTYGDYPELVRRCVESIRTHVARERYRLVVGGNAVSPESESYLHSLESERCIDRLVLSPRNLNKCPMMRMMLEGIDTEYIWWFDDDIFIEDSMALDNHLNAARESGPSHVMWGKLMYVDWQPDDSGAPGIARQFVRTASWYRGLTPPGWEPGGKGEMNFGGESKGDGRWFFIAGGCWLIRTSTVRALNWPDPRLVKNFDDIYLGEAIRQQGWRIGNIDNSGVTMNEVPRRGDAGLISEEVASRLTRP